MKRKIVLYPIFFAIGFLITVDIPLLDVPLLYGLLLLLLAAVWWGAYRVTKDGHRAGFLTTLVMGWALYYGTASNVLVSLIDLDSPPVVYLLLLVPWTIIFLFLGSKFFWRRIGSAPSMVTYLNLTTAAMLLFYGYQVAKIEAHAFIDTSDLLASGTAGTTEATSRPDIYYLILDAYARADVLEEMYGYDNAEFVRFLSERGFYIAGQSRSNYMNTELSLASSLNMSYLRSLSTGRLTRASVLKRLIAGSQVRSRLESLGYQIVTFSTPFYFTDITDADVFLSLKPDRARTTYWLTQIVPRSAAAYLFWGGIISPSNETYRDHQERIMYMFDQLGGEIPTLPGPKFVFAHFIAPHTPYVFDENGPVTPAKPYVQDPLTNAEEMRSYTGQLAYINPLVEQMIDDILRNSASPPIIIIQADHGGNLYYSSRSKDETCLKERASILNAYYFPGLVHTPLYESITPVNSFRIVFNEYFGTQYEIVEDEVYYSGRVKHYQFTDVTKDSERPCQLP